MNVQDHLQKTETLMGQGQADEARIIFEALCRMEHHTAHERGLALFGLGACFVVGEEYDAATSCLREAWDLLFNALDPKNPYTTRTMVLLSRTLLAVGDLEQGMDIGRGALQNLMELYGPEDEQTATAAFFLSSGAYQKNSLVEAESLVNLALHAWEKNYGHTSLPVATCLDALGRLRMLCGEKREGLDFHRKTMKIKLEVLGDHEITAASLGHVGMGLADLGEWREAEKLLGRALKNFSSIGTKADAKGTAAFRERYAECKEMLFRKQHDEKHTP